MVEMMSWLLTSVWSNYANGPCKEKHAVLVYKKHINYKIYSAVQLMKTHVLVNTNLISLS